MVWVIIEIFMVSRRAASIHPHVPSHEPIQSSEQTAKMSNNGPRQSVKYTKFVPFLSNYLPKVSEDTMKKLRTPLMFSIVFFGFWIMVSVYRLTAFVNVDKYKYSSEIWVKCIFSNYDGYSDDWKRVCGAHPSYRISFFLTLIYNIFQAARGVILATIYLANPNVWISVYNAVSSFAMSIFPGFTNGKRSRISTLVKDNSKRKKASLVLVKRASQGLVSPAGSTRNLNDQETPLNLTSPANAQGSNKDENTNLV
jgi:hypothetical protein